MIFAILFAILPSKRQPKVVHTARVRETRANPCNTGRCAGLDEGHEPRVGVARVPFWAGARGNPNQTAVPASPGQPTRGYSRAGGPVDLWGLRVVPGFLYSPPIL